MNRRDFFRGSAAAAVCGPSIVKEALVAAIAPNITATEVAALVNDLVVYGVSPCMTGLTDMLDINRAMLSYLSMMQVPAEYLVEGRRTSYTEEMEKQRATR